MAAQVLAVLASALAALGAGWWSGWLGDGVPGWARSLGPWLFALLTVGSWKVLRAARPYRRGALLARLWDGLYHVQAGLLGLALGLLAGAWLRRVVAGLSFATPLEGLAVPAGVLGGLAAGLALYLALRGVPAFLLGLRLKGAVSAVAVEETLALGGAWVPVLALFGVLLSMGAPIGLIDPRLVVSNLWDLGVFLGISAAATLAYALPRLWITRSGAASNGALWIVLPRSAPPGDWQGLVDRIAAGHRDRPVIVVSPPDAVPRGEHLYLADRLGLLDTLFPRLAIEVRDWQRCLPPAEGWSGLGQRQIHPPPELMPLVLNTYLGDADRVVLIAGPAEDMEGWRGRLPVERTRVVRMTRGYEEGGIDLSGQPEPDRLAGYRVVASVSDLRGMSDATEPFTFAMLLKRAFDLFAAGFGLLLLAPVFLGLAAWIRIDSPGPIFFRQERVGRGGKTFRIHKFRTMVINAEALGMQITAGVDPRITRSGRLLRKYKLDELPQLIDVLLGDMSLVGPRPEVPRYVALYSEEQRRVLDLVPGVTDLASLRFHNESELLAAAPDPERMYVESIMPEKIRLNLAYAERANLFTDIDLILRTLGVLGQNEWSRRVKQVIMILADAVLLPLSLWLALSLGRNHPYDDWDAFVPRAILLTLLTYPVFIRVGLYRAVIRHLGSEAYRVIGKAVAISAGILLMIVYLWPSPDIARLTPLYYAMVAFFLVGSSRWLARALILIGKYREHGIDASADTDPQARTVSPTLTAKATMAEDAPAEATAPPRPRVFISFANPYSPYVRMLDRLLRPHVELRYDMDLHAGDEWRKELERMLSESDAVIAVVGAETAGRDYPVGEIRAALAQGKQLFPVFVDSFEDPAEVRAFMAANLDGQGGIQWLGRLEGAALEQALDNAAARILAALGYGDEAGDVQSDAYK